MRIGKFEIEHLSEGIFEAFEDGSFRKVDSNSITGQSKSQYGEELTAKIGIDPILIKSGKHNILIDTGLGWGLDYKSSYTNTSNLITNLDIFGLTPDDITHVVLTHLHFDHAGGSTFVNEQTATKPTMFYANYFVQKIEWAYALQQVGKEQTQKGAHYDLDELYRLAADEKLVFIVDTHFELLPGIELIRTGGHTPGHQIVKIQSEGETAYILGDLLPSEDHLNQYAMKQMDVDPLQSKKAKTLLMRQAYEENAVLLFYHSIHTKAGRLLKDVDRRYMLEKIQ
jgi:glyoxylase-like metal-dependent hydrolase (beta-lactamase superfamily II)